MKSLFANVLAIACLAAAVSIALSWVGDTTTPPPPGHTSPPRLNEGQAKTAPPAQEQMTRVENGSQPQPHETSARSPLKDMKPARPLSPSGVVEISDEAVGIEKHSTADSGRGAGYGSRAAARHAASFRASPSDTRKFQEIPSPHPMNGPGKLATTATAPVKPAVAAVLLTHLPDEVFNTLTAHEQLAITELGTYAEEALENPDVVTPQVPDGNTVPDETPVKRAARIRSEADGYLRATLGFARFNQLSALASGLISSPASPPSPQHF